MKELDWKVEEDFHRLPAEFYTLMPAEGVGRQVQWVHGSPGAARLLGLGEDVFLRPDTAEIFSGRRSVAGFRSLAMVYAGHQFGSYVPRLGDGRALLIAQARNEAGELWDVQLKGAGRTPYSRFGDGRAVMRSTIREYLASEAMAALGIPTTRALGIVATGEGVRRETVEPGAVLTRLARSHVRFGHFEYFHYTRQPEMVRALVEHVRGAHFPEAKSDGEWYGEVVKRTAELMAAWQAVGFAHGVMNTDNMSILGWTIDYGPYGFLDGYEPGFICNHSDETGRYAFEQQPGIAKWNLWALANALTTILPVEALGEALNEYDRWFSLRYFELMRGKLGWSGYEEGDAKLLEELLGLLAKGRVDYTLAFRRLADGGARWLELFAAGRREEAVDWLARYEARSAREAGRRERMRAANPKYVLRNWVAETAIRAVEDEGDVKTLDRIFRMLERPYEEQPENEEFAAGPPEKMRHLCVSCSS